MIFIAERIQEEGVSEAKKSQEGVRFEDFEERLPGTDFDVPGNPRIFLRLRVLYAHAPRVIDNKPQHRFVIEYLTLGRGDYIPTSEDIQMAYDHARQMVEDNLLEWSDGDDALAEVVIPTKESIQRLLESHT